MQSPYLLCVCSEGSGGDNARTLSSSEPHKCKSCADPESFVRGGLTLKTFFLVVDERGNITISRPSSA